MVRFRDLRAFGRIFGHRDRKSTRLNSSHSQISYAVFCLKKKNANERSNRLTLVKNNTIPPWPQTDAEREQRDSSQPTILAEYNHQQSRDICRSQSKIIIN